MGHPVRLLTTCGRSVGGRRAERSSERYLDVLAELSTAEGDLRALTARIALERRSDTLVAITAATDIQSLGALGALSRRFDDALVVTIGTDRYDQLLTMPPRVTVIRARTGEEFAERWNIAVAR
jgi:hypothetical protein